MLSPLTFGNSAYLTLSSSGFNLTPNGILDLILPFVAGLFFGLAIKKGLTAFILGIVGVVIGSYIGLTFLPKISLSYEIHKWSLFLSSYLATAKFGSVVLTTTVIIFLIGLAIGLWKG